MSGTPSTIVVTAWLCLHQSTIVPKIHLCTQMRIYFSPVISSDSFHGAYTTHTHHTYPLLSCYHLALFQNNFSHILGISWFCTASWYLLLIFYPVSEYLFVVLSTSDKNVSGVHIFSMKGILHLSFSFLITSPSPPWAFLPVWAKYLWQSLDFSGLQWMLHDIILR